MMMLESIDRWAITAGIALIICACFGLLSATNFPGFTGIKQLRAFPALRVLYIAITGAVFIAFAICFYLIATSFASSSNIIVANQVG